MWKEANLNGFMCGCFCINKILFTQTHIYLGHLYIGMINENDKKEEMLLCKNKSDWKGTSYTYFLQKSLAIKWVGFLSGNTCI